MRIRAKAILNGKPFDESVFEAETKTEAWGLASSWLGRKYSEAHAAGEVMQLDFLLDRTDDGPSQSDIDTWMSEYQY